MYIIQIFFGFFASNSFIEENKTNAIFLFMFFFLIIVLNYNKLTDFTKACQLKEREEKWGEGWKSKGQWHK